MKNRRPDSIYSRVASGDAAIGDQQGVVLCPIPPETDRRTFGVADRLRLPVKKAGLMAGFFYPDEQ